MIFTGQRIYSCKEYIRTPKYLKPAIFAGENSGKVQKPILKKEPTNFGFEYTNLKT